jgi:hydroxymethylpyrimidine pyrophosphatase-like HAD family hydrolase
MIVHVLACDFDGTIAERGRVSVATATALSRVRASGRKLILVTGRMLPDLRTVYPGVDARFDAVVAENGAVLYFTGRREVRVLGARPEPALVDALQRRRVPFELGSSIVATDAPFAESVLAAIREAGVERSLVFNKGSLMLLPGGVSKGTGLEAALQAFGLSAHNTVGIGDAENDHAFLALCEFAIAVADAVPALQERADLVTPEPGPRGAVWFIEQHLLDDASALAPRIARHRLEIGRRADATPVEVPAHGTRLLVVGPSRSGKSTISGVIVERLVDSGRSVCLLDPEGDHEPLTELEGVVSLGGKTKHALPAADELEQLLRRPKSSLVLDLSALSRADKVEYAIRALATVAAVRATSGLPHWVIIDEAHHIFPADGSPATELLRQDRDPLCLITLGAGDLAAELRAVPDAIASTDLEAFGRAVLAARPPGAAPPRIEGGPLAEGEAAIAWLDAPEPRAIRFRVARRRIEHRRHRRKYAEGELPPERSFYFRGATGALNLRAPNLIRFCELAEGVDDATWMHHLRRGEYSAWIRETIKDPELADEVAGVESSELGPAETRQRALGAVRQRYAV